MSARPYQISALRAISAAWATVERTMLVMATGTGKCLGRGTPVLMFDGTIVPVEDVRVGDLLMGPDSGPRRVLSCCTGVEQLYRVVPKKGEPYIVNESHVLSLKITGGRQRVLVGPRSFSSGDVANISIAEYMSSSRTFRHRAKGWRAAIDFNGSSRVNEDMPPYILGAWLGDGTTGSPSISGIDEEVIGEFRRYADSLGLSIRLESSVGKCPTYRVTDGRNRGRKKYGRNRMLNALRDLGVLNNKHVPVSYSTSSRQDRLDLLAGLLDTDGSLTSCGFDYISKLEHLADSVCFVARSLGLAAYKRRTRKTCSNGTTGTYYRVSISGDCSMVPCRVPRKKATVRQQKKSVLVTGIRLESVGVGDYFGFEIAGPDRLFVLGDFTVTHNTWVMREVARRRKEAKRGRSLLLAHRRELLTQAAAQFDGAGLTVELESGGSKAAIQSMWPSDAVVATIQTMRGRRLEMWPRNAFATVFVDEAHHATSASYRAVLDYFDGAKVLGVTATPDRGDGVALGGVIDHLAYEYNLRQAIEDGFLCPLRALAVDMPTVDLSSVRTTNHEHGRDLSAEDLSRVMMGEQQLHEMAGPIARESKDRSTVVFLPSVELAHELTRVLRGYGCRAEALDGKSSSSTRSEVLERYQRGELDALGNCALFTEGWDAQRKAPNGRAVASCIAIARPTKSRALYSQMVGRGTRPDYAIVSALNAASSPAERRAIIAASVKPDCLILDLAPANMRHALVAPVDLLIGKPLPDDELKAARAAMSGDDVLAALKKGEDAAKAAEERRARDRGRVVADVAYRRIERDPFDELGIDVEMGAARGPAATEKQIVALANAGFKLSKPPTKRQASAIMDELSRRRARGLCTVKQMRTLAEKGLRKDLSFDDARAAMDALVAAGWRVTPEIDERWGQRSAVDEAEDFDRSV